jgi:hypothetical protein
MIKGTGYFVGTDEFVSVGFPAVTTTGTLSAYGYYGNLLTGTTTGDDASFYTTSALNLDADGKGIGFSVNVGTVIGSGGRLWVGLFAGVPDNNDDPGVAGYGFRYTDGSDDGWVTVINQSDVPGVAIQLVGDSYLNRQVHLSGFTGVAEPGGTAMTDLKAETLPSDPLDIAPPFIYNSTKIHTNNYVSGALKFMVVAYTLGEYASGITFWQPTILRNDVIV